jgi:hypothetical protein
LKRLSLLLALAISVSCAFATKPDLNLTPGEICTPDNPDFAGYRYTSQIAYCKRNVTQEMKQKIADAYGGIPKSEWSNYEFDHLIPLSSGGDSSLANLWPQPIDEAKEKDKIEKQTYDGLNNGSLTQEQAIQIIRDWIDQH